MNRSATLAWGLTLVAAGVASTALAQPRTFTIDPAHSEVGFSVRHLFSKVHGSFGDFSGTFAFDPRKLATSSVEATIRDTSIYTANEMRDRHLRSEDFFWVEKHPLTIFKSTKVIPGKTAARFKVEGDLTLRGVTRPVTLDVEYLGQGAVAVGGNSLGTRAGFVATTTINRKDFAIVWNKALDQGGVMVGDDVTIELSVEGVNMEAPAAPSAAPKK